MQGLATIVLSVALIAFSSATVAQEPALQKRKVGQLLAPACEQIAAHASDFSAQRLKRATQYFTAMFLPSADGKLREEDREACLDIEGACLVGDLLYDSTHRQGIQRSTIQFKFGQGSGKGQFNTTNALDPCRTFAADHRFYPTGTVLYIPEMKNKTCPQTGKPVDGCFIVGDVGGGIKGNQRFDIFTGECAQYDKRTNTCGDRGNAAFGVAEGTPFHVIGQDQPLAAQLRKETDAFINNDWQ